MLIGIVVGSTRPGRKGADVGAWVVERLATRADVQDGAVLVQLLDLADFRLSLLDEPTVPSDANRDYEDPHTRAWSAAVDACDGFVWITPEYNHSVPAAMKNALDLLYPEWKDKTVAYVSYGGRDSGVRAVEHWRVIADTVQLVSVRPQVSLSTTTDWAEGELRPGPHRDQALDRMFAEQVRMTRAVMTLRVP